MNQATQIHHNQVPKTADNQNKTLSPMFIVQTTCYLGGALLTATGVIASLCALFLYHPTTSLFKTETIAIYLLQTIAGFAAVATAHYLTYHYDHNPKPDKEPADCTDTKKQQRPDTTTT